MPLAFYILFMLFKAKYLIKVCLWRKVKMQMIYGSGISVKPLNSDSDKYKIILSGKTVCCIIESNTLYMVLILLGYDVNETITFCINSPAFPILFQFRESLSEIRHLRIYSHITEGFQKRLLQEEFI